MIPSPAETVRKNPNATLGLALTPVGAAVAWASDRYALGLEPWQSAAVAGGILSGGLWVGRSGARAMAVVSKRGLVGIWRALLFGNQRDN